MYAAICKAVQDVWIIIGIVWAIGYLFSSRAKRRESIPSRLLQVAITVPAFVLVFAMPVHGGYLSRRFLPPTPAAAWSGLAMVLTGAGVAVAARLALGRNWSGTVTVKYGHTLVRSGPYAIVRHPIYSGVLLGLLGTAISFGRVQCLFGAALATVGFWQKWRIEERFMTDQFGAQYDEYRRNVRALIPYIW